MTRRFCAHAVADATRVRAGSMENMQSLASSARGASVRELTRSKGVVYRSELSKNSLRLAPAPVSVDARPRAKGVDPAAPHRDEPAYSPAEFRNEVFHLVYRQMHALAGRSADLNDLAQTAAEQAFRSLSSFEGRSSPSTWTYRVCYFTLLKRRRFYQRWLRRFAYTEDVASERLLVETAPDGGELLERRERARRLRAALDRVSPKRRAVVILHDLEELEIAEIAEIVGAKETTVRSRLRDGRKRLAEELHGDPYFGSEACGKEDE
jgi:RNA polymerase sigma-70 factor (ECF subfamily)